MSRRTGICLAALIVTAWLPLNGQSGQPPAGTAPPPADTSVPWNLRPVLVARQSEMRLVSQRYSADRALLSGNYLGGGRGGGRGGAVAGAPEQAPALSVSPNRIARLKRFDIDWQAALDRLDTSKLSAGARTDLETLEGTIRANLAQLDADAASIARMSPLMPFAPRIVALYEARVRIEDIDAQAAAGELTAILKEIQQIRARLEPGPGGAAADALRADRDTARGAAAAVDSLPTSLTDWFAFRNGYDPLVTWWMELPFKHVDGALREYAAFLRDTVAAANLASNLPQSPATPIAPAPAPAFSSVPDLAEILALPQDETPADASASFRTWPTYWSRTRPRS